MPCNQSKRVLTVIEGGALLALLHQTIVLGHESTDPHPCLEGVVLQLPLMVEGSSLRHRTQAKRGEQNALRGCDTLYPVGRLLKTGSEQLTVASGSF